MLAKSLRFTEASFTISRPKIFFRGEIFDCAKIILVSRKFTCVVSKKTYKRAVDRNLIKRRVYSSIHSYLKAHHTIVGSQKESLIFYPKKNSLHVPYRVLDAEIHKLFATL